jgi:hypothetical protein
MRRFLTPLAAILVQTGMMVFLCGCSRSNISAVQAMQPTSSQPSSPTSSQPSSPTSSQPSSTSSIQEDTTGKDTTDESEEILRVKRTAAPDLEGAEKQIADINGLLRVIYKALPGNPYSLGSGEVMGEYKHEVFLGEQRTGGVALRAPVVEMYLQKALKSLPPQQSRWLLTLPVDLSDCRSLRPVRIDLSARPFIDRPYYIRISAEKEQLGVVNILDGHQQVVVDEFKMYGLHYLISRRSLNSTSIIAGEEMAFLFVVARFQEIPQAGIAYAFGDRVGLTSEPVLAGLTSVRGPLRVHDYDCILKIDGFPVFLMANDKG